MKNTLNVSGTVTHKSMVYQWSGVYHRFSDGDDFVDEILVIGPHGHKMHETDEMPAVIAAFVDDELIEHARDQYGYQLDMEGDDEDYYQDMNNEHKMEQLWLEGVL